MRYDPLIFNKKSVFMQRIADQVRRGYRHYALGEVSIDRARPLAMKFARLYGVHLHRNQKARERAYGHASACLLWWRAHTDTLVFCLLVTPGPHAAHSLESLRDVHARDTRLTLGEYELVQRPRAESLRPAWTWRLTQEAYEGWRLRSLEVCRGGNDFEVTQYLDALHATPGFAGVREQVKKVKSLFRAEWKRRRPNGKPCPASGTRHRYVQRLPNSGLRLWTLSKQAHQ
ncbi:hypothetical protein [Nitrogeniibacter aestuarii]|uniref:hypothetical protein n=1 Tax=Nitrogeniibacter aestuarii TaxID=2815343 RepID=UPI001E4E5FF8|nr:hypothetical protein [Nitrogeniibacter aestuarii]